jgi:hypothetical protein
MANQSVDITKYAARLYVRRSEGIILTCANVSIGKWKPQPKLCHGNVAVWCDNDTSYQPVRGWLHLELAGIFLAHSVVRKPNGELCDITPLNAHQQYPFILAEESEAEYEDLIVRRNISQIVHQQSQSPFVVLARTYIP